MKQATKIGLKGVLKVLCKAIPGVGLGIGIVFAYMRMKEAQKLKGWNKWIEQRKAFLEVASGVASIFVTVGTAIALAIDIGLLVHDLYQATH